MAIYDARFELSDGQLITNANAISSNIIDFTLVNLEMGAGEPLWLNVRIGASFIPGGGTSITFSLYYHTAITVNSGTVIYATPAIAVASLGAGQWILRMPLPVNVDEERYVGLYYTTSGTHTVGSINAWLDHGPQSSYDTQVTTSNI